MNKNRNIRLCVSLDEIVTVDSEYAQKHLEELMDRVCREDIAILVRDHNGSVVLAPYWWYHLFFGLDPKQVIRNLVEESRVVDAVKVLKYFVVANGYIQLSTPASAQELLQELMPLVKDHPHSACWTRMLDRLSTYWDSDHSPKLISAAFAGDRKVYLLFTDSVTRLVDMRRFIGRGLKEADLETEESFRDGLTLVTEALVWMPVAGEKQAVFFSEDLLRESEPVDVEKAAGIWDLPEYCCNREREKSIGKTTAK